nr:immunoglobulin light chain junction region [Macaca mulatta]MOV77285.1 immunoglobulin light chain junction region [Macaca mulatta]
CLQYNFDPLTF